MKLYTKCDDIPLYKFIEVYKGNLEALIISGKPTEEELRKASSIIIDEYNEIINNKNLRFIVSCHSSILNYNIKILIIRNIYNLLKYKDYNSVLKILPIINIRIVAISSENDIEKLEKCLSSTLAYIKLRLKMAEEQIKKSESIKKKVDFTKERMIVSAHFKLRIDARTYTAGEYANLVRLMLDEIEENKSYGK